MQPAPSNPGCVLCLLQLSASMAGAIPTADGPWQKARFARDFLGRLLGGLVTLGDAGFDGLQVGVLAHQGGADGAEFISLLPGADDGTALRPLATLAGEDARRLREVEPRGEAPAAAGLAQVYRLLQHWLQRHPGAGRPLVVHCTDDDADEDLAFVRRSLQALDTPAGNAVLFNCVYSDRFNAQMGLTATRPGTAPWSAMWDASSPLPWQDPPQRGLTINAAPVEVLLQLVRELAGPGAALLPAVAASPPYTLRALHTARAGNDEVEWEDAFNAPPDGGTIALADGASEGIFSRAWAHLLTKKYVAQQPDPAERAALDNWLADCRRDWRLLINYPTLRWSQQAKVDRSGAAATFLALQLAAAPTPGEDGPIVWRAWAVGDVCLFWFRADRLRAAFPILSADDFGPAPALIRTAADAPEPVPLTARGQCRPGDLLVLATDAVAQWVLRACADGRPPDWSRWEGMDADAWKAEMDELRRDNRIVNDDCTVLLVRIREGGAG